MGEMKIDREHECEKHASERTATASAPYHYVNSGLPNVYLAGVKYRVCKECNMQEADIPALNQLLTAIARVVVDKHSSLNGHEMRFLRKRLKRKSKDFAELISVEPQTLSRLEGTDAEKPLDAGRDKLVRLVYRGLASDARAKNVLSMEKKFEQWLTSIQGAGSGERIVATWLKSRHWHVESSPCQAA